MRTALWLVALAAILLGALLFFTGGEKATSQSAAAVASSVSSAKAVPEPPRPAVTSTAGLLPLPLDNTGTKPTAVSASASPSTDAAPLSFAEAMQASDPFVRRAAIEAALAKRDVTALPRILQVDLTQNGYEAAAAIDATGKLAAMAPEPAKRAAVKTLGKWLKQESARTSNDAKGNVPIAVEALGDTKSSDAIAPLVEMLDSASQPLNVETLIVDQLQTLNARSATASVERFVVRVRAKQPQDQLERDLIDEALAAANAALAKWR